MISTFLSLSFLALISPQHRVEVLHSDIPGSPTSAIPGFPGIEITSFREIDISPSGRYITQVVSQGSTPKQFVLLDTGEVLADGGIAPWTSADTLILTYSPSDVGVNDLGQFFVSTRVNQASGGQVVWVARRNIGGWVGMYDSESAIPGAPGTFFNFFDQLNGLNSGSAAFSTSVRGLNPDIDRLLLQPPAVVEHKGISGPHDPASGALIDTWFNWSADGFFVTPDGAHRLVRGTVLGNPNLTHEIIAWNGDAVLTEQAVVPGSGFVDPILEVYELHLAPDGTWSAVGVNDPPGSASPREFWVVRNGAVVAQSGDAILPGDTRNWHNGSGVSQGLHLSVSNGTHHYIGGYAKDSITSDLNQVLVREGDQVVLQQGDPIDLDGNGLFDDGVEFKGFSGTRWATVDRTGRIWLTVFLFEPAANKTHEALIRVTVDAIDLDVPVLVAGMPASIDVNHATPGKSCALVYSMVGPGPSSFGTAFGALAISVGSPFSVAPVVVVPASGTANFQLVIPPALQGIPVWAQAAVFDPTSAELSQGYSGSIQ